MWSRVSANRKSPGPTSPQTPSSARSAHDPLNDQASQRMTGEYQQNLPVTNHNNPANMPLFLCQPFVDAALLRGGLSKIVQLSKYTDQAEWIASHFYSFTKHLQDIYDTLSEFCTPTSCSTMSAGENFDYTWVDQTDKQVKLPASTYIEYVLDWVQKLLKNEDVFPVEHGRPFRSTFIDSCRHIYKQLFRILAHLYWNHFHQMLHLQMEGHVNSYFAHFVAFGQRFQLMDAADLQNQSSRCKPGVADLMEKWQTSALLK